jgi:peptidyl-prolyl cis-trans isomerase B (cyclophilin B)
MTTIFLSCVQKPEEYAVIDTEEGQIVLKFLPDVAPKHVESFKILARDGYFNGTSFHRIIPGF